MSDLLFNVTFFANKEPVGEFEVTAPNKIVAVTKVNQDHPELLDTADDYIVIQLPDPKPEASER